MKLILIVSLIACSYADKLDRTYLPPASAATAGGSPGSLTAPGVSTPQGSQQGLGQNFRPAQSNFGQSLQGGSNFGQGPSPSNFGQNPQTSNFGQSPSQSNFGQNPQGSNYGQSGSQPSYGQNQGSGPNQASSNFGPINQDSIDTAFGQPSNIDSQNAFNQPERERASIDRNAEILKYENENDGNTFSYSFETSNGISADESGVATNGVQAQGGFSYTGDDGQQYSIRYTADENGYQPQGDHLPTPPPIPEEILKSIEKNAEAAAAGTQEGAYNPEEDSNDIGGNGYNVAAPSSQSGQVAQGVSGGINGFGSQSSNTQGYPTGPSSAPQRPQGSQTGPGSSDAQGYPRGPAQANPQATSPFGSQGTASQQGQPKFTALGSGPASQQGYPRGPAQTTSSGFPTQNAQRPTSQYGLPTGSNQASGPRGPSKPSQSSSSSFPTQSGKGPFGTPSTTGPSGPVGYPSGPSQSNPTGPSGPQGYPTGPSQSNPTGPSSTQGYPTGPSQSNPTGLFGSQGQRGPSRFGTTASSSEGYPRGPSGQSPSQGFPSQRGPTPSTDYTPAGSSPTRFNQQGNQNTPSGVQGGDAGYQYNRPTGSSGQSNPKNQASFPTNQYTPTQASPRPTSQGFLNNQRPSQFGSTMLPSSSRPQNTLPSSQAPTASGYPQNNPRPTSQYGAPASDKPQFNSPSSSPFPSKAPAFSQTNPQFGASSTISTIRPTSSQNFGPSGSAIQPQDESGYQYNRPQNQFDGSRPSAGPASGPSAPQGTRPSFSSNIPTGPSQGPQGSRPTGPAETGFPTGPSSTGYPTGPASTGSRPTTTGPSGFPRPNTAAENIQGNFGSPSGPMPQSAPYKYDAPQNPARPNGPQSTFDARPNGPQSTFDARPNQGTIGSFAQPGQNRPGVTSPAGQDKPGQEFGGPRQPPSFSPEEGYKY